MNMDRRSGINTGMILLIVLLFLNRLRSGNVSLSELYRECRSRSEIVATFVSVLELCSIGSVHIEREEESYSLSFIGGNVDEIMEKIEET